jgi:fibronectin type 3 domain-containing protein
MNSMVHSPQGSSPSQGSPEDNRPKNKQNLARNSIKVGAAANRRLVNKSINGALLQQTNQFLIKKLSNNLISNEGPGSRNVAQGASKKMPKSYQVPNNKSIDISMNIIGQNGYKKSYKGTIYNERPPIIDYVSNN